MQSTIARVMPSFRGFSGYSNPVGPSWAGMPKLDGPPQVDQVHFGKIPRFGKIPDITGPIPPQSLVILLHGMYSPAQSMVPLADYLTSKGHTTCVLDSPVNRRAGSALESTKRLSEDIDRERLNQASEKYTRLLSEIKKEPSEWNRIERLRERLHLKDNALGRATAKATLGLMFTPESKYQKESDFTSLWQEQKERKAKVPDHKLLSSMVDARKDLKDALRSTFVQHRALKKTVDHVFDQIMPRVVLVGHSMGGFVSMLNLFNRRHDTALVVGLAAPGENGTEVIPSGLAILKSLPDKAQQGLRGFVEYWSPGIAHVLAGSAETNKLKAKRQSFNTTIFAIGMPGEHDGLVGEKNFKMNDDLDGRINVVVTPRQANIIEVGSPRLHNWINLNPLYNRFSNQLRQSSDFVKSIAHHCGLLQHHERYWSQEGDILRGILEAPKNKNGEYDYENGTPDYKEACQQIQSVIKPKNYEAERLHFLNVLLDHLQDAEKAKSPDAYQNLLEAYQPLLPKLKAISHEQQPIKDGVADKAQALLRILDPHTKGAAPDFRRPLRRWKSTSDLGHH